MTTQIMTCTYTPIQSPSHPLAPPPPTMCEVLPTIDETSPSPDGENSRLEQLMITMLEERDQSVY